jgi:hypothetical protein
MVKAPQKAKDMKKFNGIKWGFLISTSIALSGAIAAWIVVPEVRCSLGWKSEACPVHDKDVSFLVQSEDGRSIGDVKVQVLAQGPPEIHYTDSNGYAVVKITNKGTVRVSLEKPDYPVQNLTINLENDQNTVRIIRLNKQSSDPKVQSVAKISDIIATQPSPETTPSVPVPSPMPSVSTFVGDKGVLFKNKQGSLTAQSEKERYPFILGNPGMIDLQLDDVSNEALVKLYRDSGNGTPVNYPDVEESATRSKPGVISKRLETGKYFITVVRKGGDTKYRLSGVNYTERTRDLGALKFNSPSGENSTLTTDNRRQFYRFNLGSPGVVTLGLKDVQNETAIALYKDNGDGLPRSYPESTDTATNIKQGKIETRLETGNYVIAVDRQGGDTSYSLSVSSASP